MPRKRTLERAARDKREGKSASTQAGEFIKETIDDIRKGKHGARSTKQAIAIGLSKARRAGVDLPPPKKGKTPDRTRRSAEQAYEAGHSKAEHKVNPKRSKATTKALQREGNDADHRRHCRGKLIQPLDNAPLRNEAKRAERQLRHASPIKLRKSTNASAERPRAHAEPINLRGPNDSW